MPFIEGAMEHIQRIYEWNAKVDEMRMKSLGIQSIDDYYEFMTNDFNGYFFNHGLRMYLEERHEYTTARLAGDNLEAVDAIVDQFVVAIGEIRKCALSDEYEKIDFWETKARVAYDDLGDWVKEFAFNKHITYYKYLEDCHGPAPSPTMFQQQALTAVIDALFTRFGDDAYIDENGKFIKSKGYTKPDLSFLLWK